MEIWRPENANFQVRALKGNYLQRGKKSVLCSSVVERFHYINGVSVSVYPQILMLKELSCYCNVFMFGLQVKEKVSTYGEECGEMQCVNMLSWESRMASNFGFGRGCIKRSPYRNWDDWDSEKYGNGPEIRSCFLRTLY